MELSNNTISKVIIECLTNESLYKLVKNNIDGFFKFSRAHTDLPMFSGLIDYIGRIEFKEFNSIDLNAELRSIGIAEGALSEFLSSIDYLREINSDKPIQPKTVSILKSIFYSGQYEEVKGKTYEEIFEYCKSIDWVSDLIDPRFKIEDITASFDVDEISAMLSPENSIKSSMKFINDSSPNKGYFPNELVTISAAPGTGKTQFLFTEALEFIRQGKRVLYIALGDMVNYFITIRLMCMNLRISPNEAYMDLKDYLNKFRTNEVIRDNFKFVCLESGKFTHKEVFNFLSVISAEFDVFMVDYDGNFAPESENMYKEGGGAYDSAINVCRIFNKLGFIASQPKIAFWASESLGKECLAESSRKQQITDTIVTFGVHQGVPNRCGFTQIVKGRNRDLVFRVPWAAADSGQIVQIDNDMYGELLASNDKMHLLLNEVGSIDLPDAYLDSKQDADDTRSVEG